VQVADGADLSGKILYTNVAEHPYLLGAPGNMGSRVDQRVDNPL
jgi:hypothetical protein